MLKTPRTPRPGSARAALAHRDFRTLWTGMFASNIGTWIQNVVLPAYVYDRTGAAWAVGLMVFAQLGPMLLLSLLAGVVADRVDRRRILLVGLLAQMVLSVGLFALVASEAALAALIAVQAGVGIANAFAGPAYSAALPALVGPRDLKGAIALNSVQLNGARVIGPVIAAILATWGFTTAQLLLVNAATYLFVIAAVMRLHLGVRAGVDIGEQGWARLSSGIRIVRQRADLRRLLVTMASFSLISLPYIGLFPAVAEENFGIAARSSTFKWLYAVWGSGALVGALAVGTVLVGWDTRRVIRRGFGAFAVLLAAFAVVSSPVAAFVIGFGLGAAYFATTTALLTLVQARIADHERGRVMSLWFMAFGGTVPVGNLIFAPVVDAAGARGVLLLGAVWAAILVGACDMVRLDARSGRRDSDLEESLDDPFEPRHS